MLSRLLSQIFSRNGRARAQSQQIDAHEGDEPGRQSAPATPKKSPPSTDTSPAQWHAQAAGLAGLGRLDEAAACYLAAIDAYPENVALRVNASNVLKEMGRTAEAGQHLEVAVGLAPEMAGAWYNLGILQHQLHCFDEALEAFGHALRILKSSQDELLGQVIRSMGLSLQSAGRCLPARRFLHEMAQEYPRYASECLRNALFTWVDDHEASPEQKLAAHKEWAALYADPSLPRSPLFGNACDPERSLRVGYISGDLRSHAVSFFFEALLEYHNREAFTVFCYDNTVNTDATSTTLQQWPATWRPVASLNDDALSRSIRDDGIDILIDLSGHTARNRLDAFARKPAPVQATWLGYPLSTGMLAMDYRITDATVDPPGISESWYSERLLRLPGSAWCFRAPHNAPEVTDLPMHARGAVTLGSFNNIGKLNELVFDAWAEILSALPSARLIIARVPHGRCREAFLEQWQRRGVDLQRLELHGYLTRERYLGLHNAADFALDPFPCPGGTTSCESLWMGLPVLTLDGQGGVARAGTSIMNAAGLTDWIAADRSEYVRMAVAKASDPSGLAKIRSSMRARLAASPLMNGQEFTKNFEAALRMAWREWCAHPTRRP